MDNSVCVCVYVYVCMHVQRCVYVYVHHARMCVHVCALSMRKIKHDLKN